MKRILIISPYFPPVNAADMQRIRMSLPYFKSFGWEAEVVMVDCDYVDLGKDPLLLESIPKDIKVHKVKAFAKKWTSKLGLGSLALRSMYFYRKRVNELLKNNKYDLIYFSTTQFPVLILGSYWKKKFGIPFVIDMQDPWHSTYYEDKPKNERPPKYWFSYRLNKYLEPIAMNQVAGLISVSQSYIDDLEKRYSVLKDIPKQVITFGAFPLDFELAKNEINSYPLNTEYINLLYIGRAGYDMEKTIRLLFEAFKVGLKNDPDTFNNIRFHFIGTSYATSGQGKASVLPIAKLLQIEKYVIEQTDRIPFYKGINTMLKADALLILGSDDPQYTASKIYPYILAKKPLLAIFHPDSSAGKIIRECTTEQVIDLQNLNTEIIGKVYQALKNIVSRNQKKSDINWAKFEKYTAENMTKEQCNLFNLVLNESI